MSAVTVEFFGVPRLRAGTAAVVVDADTVGAALAAALAACPGLAGLVGPGGTASPHCLVSLDGRRFVADPATLLPPGSRLLLLSADAGG
jgi:molybdopterin converting factor small subunit